MTWKTNKTPKQRYAKTTQPLNNDMENPLNHKTMTCQKQLNHLTMTCKTHSTTIQWHAKTIQPQNSYM